MLKSIQVLFQLSECLSVSNLYKPFSLLTGSLFYTPLPYATSAQLFEVEYAQYANEGLRTTSSNSARYEGILTKRCYSFTLLTSALDRGQWSASCNSCFTYGKGPPTPRTYCVARGGGHHDQSGRSEEEKNLLLLSGIEPHVVGYLAHALVSRLNTLSRLLCVNEAK